MPTPLRPRSGGDDEKLLQDILKMYQGLTREKAIKMCYEFGCDLNVHDAPRRDQQEPQPSRR